MAFPTVTVRGTFTGQSGEPLVGAQLVATLDRRELYHGIVVPRRSSAATGDNGLAELTLFPNELGHGGSRYHIALYDAVRNVVFAGHAVFPASDMPLDLETYLEVQPQPEPSTVARQVAIVREQVARVGEAAADVATNAQTADQARQQAQAAAGTATNQADAASQSADAAAGSAGGASASAATAGDKAAIARQAANAAGDSASQAADSQTTASRAADKASAAADQTEADRTAAGNAAGRAESAADQLEQLITENKALRVLVAIEHGQPLLRDGRIF